MQKVEKTFASQTFHQKCSAIRENESMGMGADLGRAAGPDGCRHGGSVRWRRLEERKFLGEYAGGLPAGQLLGGGLSGSAGRFGVEPPDTLGGAGWAMTCLSGVGRSTSL